MNCQNNEQGDRTSNCLYMHVQTISLAALDSLVFQIYINSGKNWISIDCQNNGQTDRAGN